jgi:hypothetical protein
MSGDLFRPSRYLFAAVLSKQMPATSAGMTIAANIFWLTRDPFRLAADLASRNGDRYSPMVRITLLSGRVLFDDSLSSCTSISSYFGTVVTSPLGTKCTTL